MIKKKIKGRLIKKSKEAIEFYKEEKKLKDEIRKTKQYLDYLYSEIAVLIGG